MASKSANSQDFNPPRQGWELNKWVQTNLQPVLILRETAFKYKVLKYHRRYSFASNSSAYEWSSVPVYVDKTWIVLSYEAGALRIESSIDRDLEALKRRMDSLQADKQKWIEARRNPPSFPETPQTEQPQAVA